MESETIEPPLHLHSSAVSSLWFLFSSILTPLPCRCAPLPRLSQRDQGHDIDLEAGLFRQRLGQEGKQHDAAQGLTPEARAALVEEVASLKQKLEAKNTAAPLSTTDLNKKTRSTGGF